MKRKSRASEGKERAGKCREVYTRADLQITVWVSDHSHYVIQSQHAMTLDLGEHVLALR